MVDLSLVMLELKARGLKTVEWTGGGDPTLWGRIEDAIRYADDMGLEQGFITNGIALKQKLTKEILNKLKWVRISMNCLDYVKTIDVPRFDGTLGFSYVWNDKTNEETLNRLFQITKEIKPEYVRVVPNCQSSYEEQEENNKVLSEEVAKWGQPFFYQRKDFSAPHRCYWAYFKPFILHDGWTYPCSSVVLNTTSEKTFHDKFRWVRMEELASVYDKALSPLVVSECDHCVFRPQNDLIEKLNLPEEMKNFV
jgi:MoaA/NifB/PqqE/SkfB family radical SAM enzyme